MHTYGTPATRQRAVKLFLRRYGSSRNPNPNEEALQELARSLKPEPTTIYKSFRGKAEPVTEQDGTKPSTIFRHVADTRRTKSAASARHELRGENAQADGGAHSTATLPKSPIVARFEQGQTPMKQQAKGPENQRLAKDPWASMLASPIRSCSVTTVRLPADLLLDFNLVKHPHEDKIFAMPLKAADLSSLWRQPKKKNEQGEPKIDARVGDEAGKALPDATAEGDPSPPAQQSRSTASSPALKLPAVRFVPHKSVLKHVTMQHRKSTNPKVTEAPINGRLMPYRLSLAEPSLKNKSYWKLDMPESLGDILQRRVVAALENNIQIALERGGSDAFVRLDAAPSRDVLRGTQAGALLWFGPDVDSQVDFRTALKSFAPTLDDRGDADGLPILLPLDETVSMPVFDLPALLQSSIEEARGAHHLEVLRRSAGDAVPSGWWLLRSYFPSAYQVIEALWQLHQYSAYDKSLGDILEFDRRYPDPREERKRARAAASSS